MNDDNADLSALDLSLERNLILPDTNVLIGDIESIDRFINGGNLVVIAFTVFQELDNLKNSPRVGRQASYVSAKIEKLIFSNSKNLVIERRVDFHGLGLNPEIDDHRIIATFNFIVRSGESIYLDAFNKYKFVSNDRNMRTNAYDLFKNDAQVLVEDYLANQIKPHRIHEGIPILTKKFEEISVAYEEEVFGPLVENGGILIQDEYPVEEHSVLLVRQGDRMLVAPKDLNLMGVRPKFNGRINWGQLLAMFQLLDNEIQAVFLEGPAGTGKTLLAMAAALEHREHFGQFILINPMVPLGNKEKMGFLPGDQKDKVMPWMIPFEQNLKFLEKNYSHRVLPMKQYFDKQRGIKLSSDQITMLSDKGSLSIPIWEQYGFMAQPLEYIRGQSIRDAFIIVEESQNLSQLEIKTIITRIGMGSRIVFCGDLSQIDDRAFLSQRSSGLLYAIERLVSSDKESRLVAATLLSESVRSDLAKYASQRL